MPSGGKRTRSGPAPDPGSIRQLGKAAEWTDLPAERTGRTPDWPAQPKASQRELVLWRRHWRKPQAILWERNGQHDEVAAYVRLLAQVETGEATVAAGGLARQMRDALLLSIPAMHSAKVRIVGDETAPKRATRKIAPPAAASSRSRLRAVGDAGGE